MARKKHFIPSANNRKLYDEASRYDGRTGRLKQLGDDHALCHRLVLGSSAVRNEKEWDKVDEDDRCYFCHVYMKHTKTYREMQARYDKKRKEEEKQYEQYRVATNFRIAHLDADMKRMGNVKTERLTNTSSTRYYEAEGRVYAMRSGASSTADRVRIQKQIKAEDHSVMGYV